MATELLRRKEHWNITYDHALGETASWFYVQIRDNAKIYGRRCADSGKVLVPPRAFSDQTLKPTTDWVEVGPGGTITGFTIVYEPFQNLPDPPYAFGYVQLDGADTSIGGFFTGVDLSDVDAAARQRRIGRRRIHRFSANGTADVVDHHFRP